MKKHELPRHPPQWVQELLKRLTAAHLQEELLGDLDEMFYKRLRRSGYFRALLGYFLDVILLIHPRLWRENVKSKSTAFNSSQFSQPNPFQFAMLQNYFKIAWRNLSKNGAFSIINILGLTVGMGTAILISLWIFDELSFNRYHKHYDRIARVMQHQTFNGNTATSVATPLPLRAALQSEYASDFTHIALSSWTEDHTLSSGSEIFTKKGNCVEPAFPLMMSLKMLKGTAGGLNSPNAVLLSESTANALFHGQDPLDKPVKIDNKHYFKVAGVYEDLPFTTEFHEVSFLLPWKYFVEEEAWVKRSETNWSNNSFLLLVQIAPHTSFAEVTAKIEGIKARHTKDEARFDPKIFLHPMSSWHLYSEWENGISVRGRIQFVWLFGIIGGFVLLLACINFMNLSTARSQKRAREVGIRKAIGSVRSQLVAQFFGESLLVSMLALVLALLLVQMLLPWFNQVADKQIAFPWRNPLSWALCLGFTMFTGLLAGSYPALYLSGFRAIKVLKGTFHAGRWAALPRQVLVVVQFTVSITLVIGTLIVLRQIQHAKNRPVGFDRAGLLSVPITPGLRGNYEALRYDLLQSGTAIGMAESSSPTAEVWSSDASFDWAGKDPGQLGDFGTVGVTQEYGKTVGWNFKRGRDFSRSFSADTLSLVMNESAARFMGIKDPVGMNIKWNGERYTVIGMIEDVVTGSPFMPVQPTLFLLREDWAYFIHIRLNPAKSAAEALAALAPVFKKYNPGSPFEYKFASEEYDRKFRAEERIGQLSTAFASLAIFISCLGLFGLASFFAEQRQKEIGIRKVLGASVAGMWQLLSRDFLVLVIIACLVASPIAYYLMNDWLQHYTYRAELSWWIFAAVMVGAVIITLLTVSFQAIKAALLNPVKSLRAE
jgi:ABC-type lipoprotein release transport system permease subunit